MKQGRARFPLMAKMLLWLLVHLGVLAAAFYLFVAWQLRLGLDSFLSGTAGERLRDAGEEIATELRNSSRPEWRGILERHQEKLGVQLYLQLAPGDWIGTPPEKIPANVDRRINEFRRPAPRPPRGPGADRPDGPPDDEDFLAEFDGSPDNRPPRGPRGDRPPPPRGPRGRPPMDGPDRPQIASDLRPRARPDFLMRGERGNGYWAGIDIPLFEPRVQQPLHGLLLLRAPDISGNGLFFNLKPWITGALAVLGLSFLLWAPFFFGITRYLSRLSKATEAIADGKFDVRVGASRSDELGVLGESIESMASRLDRLVRGQKRFLGDVAHELCSPLARIRTGLGVFEFGLTPEQQVRLDSIEEDVGELSRLVSEVLAFTKASTAPGSVRLEEVQLAPIVDFALSRECPGQQAAIEIPEGLTVHADRSLLARAIANVLRNARNHGGDTCTLRISAFRDGDHVELRIADSGPGVDPADLPRLFEPFYRPDAARTREAGGSGLGLAIVRSGIEACHGTVRAEANTPQGLALVFRLPAK
ncbi:HAMP domain-containing histidine kinase [Luteolibacter sp. GHJ8]|uniref:Signal transduction histidine-protein kinase/phosphatase MprB n=1 Tax=Luteolibacter rhizosphaerae TaxID=2989719 RepID=A0ABT3GAT1_9BACT|nr:HAMP domain-containing sensor histidine kinase [Luteolibacter rhizosphaerae]MCW1916948.1 HAMP domain-containing histidine kinase [Luteolibacter rhizosphaerae]